LKIFKEEDKCRVCGISLNGRNTKGSWREKNKYNSRCGKCYLKWKKEERERDGTT